MSSRRVTLSDHLALAAKPADKEYQIHDRLLAGLMLRVQPSGARSWVFRRRVDGRPKRIEPRITMRDLVQTTLRLRPDRIVVGEIRDGAGALEMLKAWNTGHDGGLGTLHANSGSDALHRLEDLLSEVATNVPHRLIGTAVDLVVHIRRTSIGRRIDEILTVKGFEAGRYLIQDLTPEAEPIQLLSINQPERTPS